MALCLKCGMKAGALRTECDSCRLEREAISKAALAEQQVRTQEVNRLRAEAAEKDRTDRFDSYISDCFAEFEAALDIAISCAVGRLKKANEVS